MPDQTKIAWPKTPTELALHVSTVGCFYALFTGHWDMLMDLCTITLLLLILYKMDGN